MTTQTNFNKSQYAYLSNREQVYKKDLSKSVAKQTFNKSFLVSLPCLFLSGILTGMAITILVA